jgi:hypothetical protein
MLVSSQPLLPCLPRSRLSRFPAPDDDRGGTRPLELNEFRNGPGSYSRDRSRPQHQLHRQGDSKKTRARDTALAAVPPNRRRRRAGLRSRVILGLQVKRLVWTRTGLFIRGRVNAVGLSTL